MSSSDAIALSAAFASRSSGSTHVVNGRVTVPFPPGAASAKAPVSNMSDSTSSDASSVNTFDSSTSLSPYSVTSHVAP